VLALSTVACFTLVSGLSFADVDGGDAGTCPATLPEAGSPCTPLNLACEYADDSFGRCGTIARCAVAQWKLTNSPADCHSNPLECPLPNTLQSGAKCPLSNLGDVCLYDGGACGCAPCTTISGDSTQWTCVSNPFKCPLQRPPIGSPCANEGQECDWDACCSGVSVGPSERCTNGVWQPFVSGACICPPPSACTNAPPKPDASPFDPGDASDDPDSSFIDVGFAEPMTGGCGCSTPGLPMGAPGALAVSLIAWGAWWRRRRTR
jgi:MYXO-CTERM domain-containing protein